MRKQIITIGVISDTHGLLRPEAVKALEGSDFIIHAGDVGDPAILTELKRIAPVTAVRGNVDTEAWAKKLPESSTLEVRGLVILTLHNVEHLRLYSQQADVIVFGHSHKPHNEFHDETLFFNPGSAGPRRFKLPISVGRLTIADGKVHGEILLLRV
ncbi:MAG TPA: metallophosphoesterase family protein [Terriglobales bacterium]